MLTAYSQSSTSSDVVLIAKWKLPFIIAYNWMWNLARRPFVRLWQSEVIRLAETLKWKMSIKLLPIVYDCMRSGCSECGFLYSFLKGQPFTSQIEQALLRSPCSKHFASYQAFYVEHEELFIKSHVLSDRICGFKSLRK